MKDKWHYIKGCSSYFGYYCGDYRVIPDRTDTDVVWVAKLDDENIGEFATAKEAKIFCENHVK